MLKAVASIFRSNPTARIEALARQVAEVCVEDVARLVAGYVENMTLSEARGYVRARSGSIVRRHTRLAIGRHPQALQAWSPGIVRAATERIIPQVLRQTGVGVPRRVNTPLAA